MTEEEINRLSNKVIGSAINVHKTLGPGLLESVYEQCLYYELISQGLWVKQQVQIPVIYKDVHMECGFKADLVVEENIILELKSTEAITPVHHAQLITYLRLSNIRLGLLINFNEKILKEGIQRLVNNREESSLRA